MKHAKPLSGLFLLWSVVSISSCEGTVEYADGAKYTGTHVLGTPVGKGKLELPDGRVYSGNFENGLAHGHGVVTAKDGTSYEGAFGNGYPLWQGTLTLPTGEKIPVNLNRQVVRLGTVPSSRQLTELERHEIDVFIETNRPTIQWSQ